MILPHTVFFPQYPVQYLIGARSRHLFIFNEDDIFGDFESGDLTFAVAGNLFRRRCLALMEYNDCRHLFPPFFMGYSNDSHIFNLRISAYTVFYLGRKDVLTAGI